MSLALPPELRDLLGRTDSLRLLAATDCDGMVRVWTATHLAAGDDGTLHYLVVEEGAAADRALVQAIWFDRPLLLVLAAPGRLPVGIEGRVVRSHITGLLFLDYYLKLRDQTGEDLASVWEIVPQALFDPGAGERRGPVEGAYPTLHFDRIAQGS